MRRKQHDNQGGHQRLRPDRALLHAPGAGADRPGGGGGQRHHRFGHAGAPAGVRLHLRPPRPDRGAHAGLDEHRRRADRGAVRAGPGRDRLGQARRRHRDRVDRQVPHPRRRGAAPEGRRQEGTDLGAGQGRRPDRRARRQRRRLRPAAARRDLQRVLHHQLRGPDGQGAERRVRHRARLHDHDPRLHRRPDAARRSAQGPAPRPVGGGQHRAHHDRRGPGHRAGHPRGGREAGRGGRPGAGGGRVADRPRGRARPRGHRRRRQRGVRRRGVRARWRAS